MRRLAVVFLACVAVTPAAAQTVRRGGDAAADKGDGDDAAPATPAAKGDDDDDILAPVPTKGDKKPEPATEAKPKAFRLGLVPLVPLGDASKGLADEVTAAALKELGSSAGFDVVPLAVDTGTAGGGQDAAAAKTALADGNAALEKGRAFAEKLQFGKAKKAFESALERMEAAASLLPDAQPLIDCRLGLAEIAARQGQDDEARVQLAFAAVLNPELQLDAKRYPPLFIRTFARERDRALKDKRGVIFVDESGVGGSVEIDGRPTAGAPTRVSEVPPGRHLVRAVREGLPSFGAVVDLKPGEEVTVSPGFVAKGGRSWLDDLQANRFTPESARVVAEAAKQAGLAGALVGVVSKADPQIPTRLVLIDAGGGLAELPPIGFTAGLLDVSIEMIAAREGIDKAYAGGKPEPKAFGSAAVATLIAGAKAGAGVRIAEAKLRYDVTPLKEPTRTRVVDDDKPKTASGDEPAAGDDDDGRALSSGRSGKSARLDDEKDPYKDKVKIPDEVDPDAPLTEQPWFWPAVLGGGAAGAVVLASGTAVTLVALGVLPDPRPASGGDVRLVLP
ncbi:MAG: PEGA domain-containing protein [Deltaproteobacteria bacterium]|nr:PEGA domain-containing protein [Deltaproteobacteria bacterium]